MSPRAFLPAFFLISLAVFGQTASSAPGLIVNGGYVVGPIGNGQVEASTVTFASPAPTAGASISGVAGISDHALLQQGAAATSPPVVYSTASPTAYYANQAGANATQETAQPAPVGDLTPTFYAGNNASGTPGKAALSLGEVSALNKARNGAQRARTYTNADVQRLISHEGAGNTMEASNRPAAGIVAPGQNPQAAINTAPQTTASTSIQNQAPTAQSNPSQNATRSQQSTTTSQQGTASAEANASNQSAASSEARQDGGTTPQIAQPKQTETQQSSRQLPATSTMLPLLGLLGITASGVGLWFRRFRK